MGNSDVSMENPEPPLSPKDGEGIFASSRPEKEASLDLPSPNPFTVDVPLLSDAEDYEFLRGHFNVRHIIKEVSSDASSEPLYLVRLESYELETMSSSKLQSLENGVQALSNFQNLRTTYLSTSSDTETSSDEESSPDSEPDNNNRPSRRARNARFTKFFRITSSEDEAGTEKSDSSDDDLVVSGRRLRRRKHRRYTEALDSDHSSRADKVYSTRRRKTLRNNLRERSEDDISEYEAVLSKHQQNYAPKETFEELPADNAFRLRHKDTCDICSRGGNHQGKGPLVFCQGCTNAYHQACLGPRTTREHLVTKIASDKFVLQCRRCIGFARTKDPNCPHQGYCITCNEKGKMSEPLRQRLTSKQEQQLREEAGGEDPITPVDLSLVNCFENVLFRCDACNRASHFDHLSDSAKSSWQCQDCLSLPGEVDKIVAWRPRGTTSKPTSDIPERDKEYLIKWKDKSYAHCTWMPGSWFWGFVNHVMRRGFLRSDKSQSPRMTLEEAIPEDFLCVDIVFDVKHDRDQEDHHENSEDSEADVQQVDDVSQAYVKFKGLPYEDAVWESPPDRSNSKRWKDFKAAYDDWVKKSYISTPNQGSLRKHLAFIRKQKFKSRSTQPEIMTGGEIMDYQQDGLNWLYYKWFKQQNAILADEMGLGKTIQVIGLLATLIQDHKCWPFLIVVPNSTCPNWRKEIKTWVPSVRVVTYYGSSFSRKLAQDYEMFLGRDPDLRCHIVVTSYEAMVDDSSRRLLSKIPWAGLVVDEGQRLKSDKSQLYEGLSRMKFPFKVLMTGTPLQNNIKELFNLLQFCDQSQNAEELNEKYGTLSKENIPELHNLIRPFFLRRTKAQVLTFLPPIAQIIIPVTMSVLQKKLYKSILAKDPQLIKAIFQRHEDDQPLKQAERHNLNNILMQLRKCLCHPFIYSKAIEERTTNTTIAHRNLVDAAGKLQLLELMLPKLHKRGHRVLIFSQFLENLDVMEDFLDGLGLMHRRLDGRMTSLEKQKMIDDYNAEGSPYFAFLLSTRSGGVGINLATADTVIIMDPDFNPHQDMQALSRAHRIGQKNKVLVFQLMVRASAEEKIMQIGKKKMVLDHVLIDRMVSEDDDGRDLESILRHGAQALFDDDDSGDVVYTSESVDKLLDRSQAEQAKTPDENDSGSQFSFARVWANDHQALDDQLQETKEDVALNATTWEKILREREQAAAEEARKKAENLGRGKRKRITVDYAGSALNEPSPTKKRREGEGESDVDFNEEEAISYSDSSVGEPESDLEQPTKQPKVRSFKRVVTDMSSLPATGGMDGHVDENRPVCLACGQNHPRGYCRLKMAGVEHCGLCGLAHYGISRTCPHLKSDVQVSRMLEAIKQSKEDPNLVALAKKYLQGIRGDLAQRKRRQSSKAAGILANQSEHGASSSSSSSSSSPQPPTNLPAHPPVHPPLHPPIHRPVHPPVLPPGRPSVGPPSYHISLPVVSRLPPSSATLTSGSNVTTRMPVIDLTGHPTGNNGHTQSSNRSVSQGQFGRNPQQSSSGSRFS